MAKPNLEPGTYEKEIGKRTILFAYKGDETEEEVSKHPYFNTHVYLPDGKDVWWCEQGAEIANAKRLEQEEINAHIEELSQQRQTSKVSQLIGFLKNNTKNSEETTD